MCSVSRSDRGLRLAAYGRLSTDEQARNENMGPQLDVIYGWGKAHPEVTIVREYLDEGVTGTLFFQDRGGKELLADGRAGLFDGVVIRDIDRLCRDEEVGFQALAALKRAGLRLISVNEGIDIPAEDSDESTDLNVGIRILFAAQDRKKLLRKLSQGRDYRAEAGRWTNGPVPFGCDLDGAHHLILSERVISGLERTERDVMRETLLRLRDGASLGAECRRLNALGVPLVSRWRDDRDGNPRQRVSPHAWYRERLNRMAKNPIYKGVHELASRYGTRTVAVPALISAEDWAQVQEQLARRVAVPERDTKRDYLLRGLIRCVNCGAAFIGKVAPSRVQPDAYVYYWCGSHREVGTRPICYSKAVAAPVLDAHVWAGCKAFILDPRATLAEAHAEFARRRGSQEDPVARERALRQRIGAKEGEKERTMLLFSAANLLTLAEVTVRTTKINDEIGLLRRELDELAAQAATLAAYEGKVASLEEDLLVLRAQVEGLEATNDLEGKRALIRRLVSRIDVETHGVGRRKTAQVTVHYTFDEAVVVSGAGARKASASCADARHPLTFSQVLAVA